MKHSIISHLFIVCKVWWKASLSLSPTTYLLNSSGPATVSFVSVPKIPLTSFSSWSPWTSYCICQDTLPPQHVQFRYLFTCGLVKNSLMGFRICYSRIWLLGILNIWSWRKLQNGMYRKDFLTFLWSRSCERYPSYPGKKEHLYLHVRDAQKNLNRPSPLFPQVYCTQLTLFFVLSHFSIILHSSSSLA